MPRIREYVNEQTLNTNSLEQLAGAQQRQGYIAGQALSEGVNAVSRGIGDVEQHLAQTETTNLAAKLSEVQANLTTEWQKRIREADPSDPNVASEFMEKVVNPALDSIGGDLMTQQGQDLYTKSVSAVRANMFEKTTVDQANLAETNAVNSLTVMTNGLSTTLLNDPGSFKSVMGLADTYMEGLVKSFGLSSEQKAKFERQVKEQLARSAVLGIANTNPAAAKEAIARGEFGQYFGGTTANELARYADTRQNADEAQAKQALLEQRRAEKEVFDNIMSQITASTIDNQGNVVLPPDYFVNIAKASELPQADAGSIRAAMNMGKSIQHELERGTPAITDPQTFSDFRDRMFFPENDPRRLTLQQIIEARADHKLGDKDYTFFRSSIEQLAKDPAKKQEQKDFQSYMKGLKGYITKSSYLRVDALGDQRWSEFQRDAQQTFSGLRGKGMSVKDAEGAVLKMIPTYQVPAKTALDAMSHMATENLKPLPAAGAVAPRKPGESAADYLKRTGGQ